ncbi:hypothetical protein ACFIPR_003217 [Enterobacter kobei]
MNNYTQDWYDFLIRNKSTELPSTKFEDMILEYELLGSAGKEDGCYCEACGTDILNLYTIRNVRTHKRFIVGSQCVNKVKDKNSKLDMKHVKKIISNKSMDYLKLYHPKIHSRLSTATTKTIYYSEAMEIIDDMKDDSVLYTLGFKIKKTDKLGYKDRKIPKTKRDELDRVFNQPIKELTQLLLESKLQ